MHPCPRICLGLALLLGSLTAAPAQAVDCDLDATPIQSKPIKNLNGFAIGSVTLYYSCECLAASTTTTITSDSFVHNRIEAVVKKANTTPSSSVSNDNAVRSIDSPWLSVVNTTAFGRGSITRASDGRPFSATTSTFSFPASFCFDPCEPGDPACDPCPTCVRPE